MADDEEIEETLNNFASHIKELCKDELYEEGNILAILILPGGQFSISGNCCVVCVRDALSKYIEVLNIKHNDDRR